MSKDFHSTARSALMRKVRRRDTGPEMIVRRILHRSGYRFRLQAGDLPGRPDIVFRNLRKVIFVHGCFWHRHEGCSRTTTPKTRTSFWENKFNQNVVRDRVNLNNLLGLGWDALVVWECETKDSEALTQRLVKFIEGKPERV